MIKTFIFIISINWIINQTVSVNDPDAPATCTKSNSLKAQMAKSTCLDKYSEIIGCMSPCEQDLWVQANLNNKNSSLCFDCSSISKDSFKSCVSKNINGIGKGVSQKFFKVKNGISCLSKFKDNNFKNDTDIQNTTKAEMNNILNSIKKGADCFRKFLASMGTINARRRRMLCLDLATLDSM
jgi:hypothetical protein